MKERKQYADSDYVISVKDLHKSFKDTHIIKGIGYNIKPGELVSIIGRSGCGKTTLLRCMNCLEVFDSGTMRIAGITLNRFARSKNGPGNKRRMLSRSIKQFRDPFSHADDEDFKKKMYELRKRVGMVFQTWNLFPHMNVLDNVMRPQLIVKNERRDSAKLKAIQLLEKVGLEDFINRYPHQLSGGQAQRVAIARALAMSPQVMLYDEPTSALDPELAEEVMNVMKNLHHEGMTQVVVTHSMRFARNASDRVMFIEDGKIIEFDKAERIFDDPQDEQTRQYLKIIKD